MREGTLRVRVSSKTLSECSRLVVKTLGYLFILKRLAYATFKDHKYSESEKYFKVCNDLCSVVTNNPANLFSA